MAIYASDPDADLPQMKPNLPKILESILHVLHLAERSGSPPTQFEIAKTIFLADYRHLETYGRPITFDNFVAMEHGPVPSATYDMLKASFEWPRLGLQRAPWATKPAGGKKRHYVNPERSANLRKLSETDADELAKAFRDVRTMGFGKTSDFTHHIPAYKSAWNARGDNNARKMDLRQLLPEFDDQMIGDLEYVSKHTSV